MTTPKQLFDWIDIADGVAPGRSGPQTVGAASGLKIAPAVAAPASATSTTSATPTGATSVKWMTSLGVASLAADIKAATVTGALTDAGLIKLLQDLDAQLATQKSGLTAQQFADLKTIAANLNVGVTTSAYLTYVFNALVNGNAANAKWTGGAASAATLGNLAVGASAGQLSKLIGKWFLGTDLPSATVAMSGYASFKVSSSIVNKPLFAAGGPSMNDINQGYLGDCYFLSSCAERAHQNAAAIGGLLTDNGNGTYGVRFYVAGKAEYVTVNASLANGGAIFNRASDLWGSLLEKAYAQFQAINLETGNSVNYGDSYSTIGNGGLPADALEALTGASSFDNFYANGSSWVDYRQNAALTYTSASGGFSTGAVQTALISDLKAGDDLILCSYTNAYDSSGKQTLVAGHALSIYGFDQATGMFQIRNPWGTESGQNWDTNFEVSLSSLLKAGDMITVDNAGGTLAGVSASAALGATLHGGVAALDTGSAAIAAHWSTLSAANASLAAAPA